MRRKTFIAAGAVTFVGVPSAAKTTALSNNGPGFEQFRDYPYDVAFNRKKREVCVAGTGPPVLVLHELFGATPELFKFAYRIASAGFSAYVPILFGTANHHSDAIYDIQQILHVCISKEFALFDTHGRARSRRGCEVSAAGRTMISEAAASAPLASV